MWLCETLMRLRPLRWARRLPFAALVAIGPAGPAGGHAQLPPNLAYDGRPILARVRFPVVADPPGCQSPDGLGDGGWSHDYPMSVQGMMMAATQVTSLEAPVDSFVTVMSVTDPTFMQYPVAMVTEPGCWNPTDAEVKALRTYLQKGGFLVLDDLTFGDGTYPHIQLALTRVETWLKRVLPEGKLVPVPPSDPVFNSFFAIAPEDVPAPSSQVVPYGTLYGIYRDNDVAKPMMVLISWGGALGHRWRWKSGIGSGLGEGDTPSGKAYRLGLNILLYGLSH